MIQKDENRIIQRRLKVSFDSVLVPTDDFISFQLNHSVLKNLLPFHPGHFVLFHSIKPQIQQLLYVQSKRLLRPTVTLTEYWFTVFYQNNKLKIFTRNYTFQKYESVSNPTS